MPNPTVKVPWTQHDINRLRALRAEGASYDECAKALGRTRGSIAGAAEKYVKTPSPSPIVIPFRDPPPPSPAAIRLAAFDPLVAHALKIREAESLYASGLTGEAVYCITGILLSNSSRTNPQNLRNPPQRIRQPPRRQYKKGGSREAPPK